MLAPQIVVAAPKASPSKGAKPLKVPTLDFAPAAMAKPPAPLVPSPAARKTKTAISAASSLQLDVVAQSSRPCRVDTDKVKEYEELKMDFTEFVARLNSNQHLSSMQTTLGEQRCVAAEVSSVTKESTQLVGTIAKLKIALGRKRVVDEELLERVDALQSQASSVHRLLSALVTARPDPIIFDQHVQELRSNNFQIPVGILCKRLVLLSIDFTKHNKFDEVIKLLQHDNGLSFLKDRLDAEALAALNANVVEKTFGKLAPPSGRFPITVTELHKALLVFSA